MTNVLMVGLHDGYAEYFDRDPELRLHVLEEPEIHHRNEDGYRRCAPGGLVLAEYQQRDDFLEAVRARHERIGFEAVVPAWEYGVEAAGRIAEALGLRSPGRRAVGACTDKLTLRRLLAGTSVAQPRWARVGSEQEVADFFRGVPIVVKPSNRHASVGVVRVDDVHDVPWAWKECAGADEVRTVTDRGRATDYVAEEFVAGYQVSVETLVRDGEVVFDSVDLMLTAGGPYFPILSVTVPAPIPAEEQTAVVDASHALVTALEVADGTIHSEWKIHAGRPCLIECAARVPGAFTPELAERSYDGFSMYGAQIRLLAGLDPRLPKRAGSTAAVRWFHPPAGRLRAVSGVDRLAGDPAVFLHRVKVAPGELIPVCRDGWHRVGYFAVHAPTAGEVAAKTRELLEAVEFDVEPT
ncbi:ATP-grasp domain-containing protein [Streptomyces sp. NPDC047072]|uniref:ATP-grasp domain-containing protein n=1 Tax=Streptomyces sp. NPDC047072 TaxID=3154809 RepID=UPI0033D766C9